MNETIQVRSLGEISFDELYAVHSEAFKEYPVSWTKEEYGRMLNRRGYDPSLSFGAFHHGALVSFTLNGIGLFNGLPSAYDTGSGTIEQYRGQGLAGRIFEFAAPVLKQAGVRQYVLEVLQDNAPAISVYTKQGFKVTREFECYKVSVADWQMSAGRGFAGIQLKEIGFDNCEQMNSLIDFVPSWQNSFESLLRKQDDFVVIGAYSDLRLVGYGIIEPDTGDIPQLAIAESERRKGIGSLILATLKGRSRAEIAKVINVEGGRSSIARFILNNGIPRFASQFEMVKEL